MSLPTCNPLQNVVNCIWKSFWPVNQACTQGAFRDTLGSTSRERKTGVHARVPLCFGIAGFFIAFFQKSVDNVTAK